MAPGPAPAVPTPPVRLAGRSALQILALQRSAGNAAVARLLDRGGQLRCACGGIPGPDGECAACRRRRLDREARVARQPDPPTPGLVGADAVVAAVRADDVSGVVTALRGHNVAELAAMRQTVNSQIGTQLELWLAKRRARADLAGTAAKALTVLGATIPGAGLLAPAVGAGSGGAVATAEEGLRLLWPALGLVDRLLVYDEGWRELEQAQIDV